MPFHGLPCWFELSVADLEAAQRFYGPLIGWAWSRAEMEGLDYRLACRGADMVAGGFPLDACPPGTPPNWMIYISVEDCDATAQLCTALGGKVWKEPADIPGTGRFAILGDPQGAVIGIMQLEPMDPPSPGGAWNQQAPGYGTWLSLTTPDPLAGLEFYRKLFGWRRNGQFPTGRAGTYFTFAHEGSRIGGALGMAAVPCGTPPHWLPYFSVPSLRAALGQASTTGGTVLQGPVEVPGAAFIATLQDPQGAHFALVARNR
ncbi:glyoxalase/bleomycin resistance/extradiol dioxygenase family protein [Rhodobacter sp. TJ_12]|uniref:VOC family protein n=1 Tax=Rhodobacter sp. TJ_12 TaxID=2029399 RepID=UPI001CBB3AC5|nr:VOC family protein [Rhodobacter sp. TJ_12]MBZ4021232.1 glyoxalase/bleomycin resistance/extradiol dioxygenase family protein [Rhodobacter sp. TJ_12]